MYKNNNTGSVLSNDEYKAGIERNVKDFIEEDSYTTSFEEYLENNELKKNKKSKLLYEKFIYEDYSNEYEDDFEYYELIDECDLDLLNTFFKLTPEMSEKLLKYITKNGAIYLELYRYHVEIYETEDSTYESILIIEDRKSNYKEYYNDYLQNGGIDLN
jgi:hypothetical protein